ncbi:MAG: exodeoxyribonuclease III [Clostridia bacterium]|nr:exodeoxyribonuclease III [Clostridia bacterium]
MRLVSWNVNGFRAVLGKGFGEIFNDFDADILCLQETKMQPGQAEFSPEGYRQFWNSAEKKGYSGTAVFTKREPLSVVYGIGEKHLDEGRVITLEFSEFYFVCAYVPNAQDGLKRIDYRMEFEDDMRAYLSELDGKKPVIYTGDLNVAHEEIDLKNPKSNIGNPGFSYEERGKFTELLGAGFIDSFRELHPEEQKYSWWSYRFRAREKNIGWRIDYFVTSARLLERIKASEIHTDVFGSDHCPVSLEIDI